MIKWAWIDGWTFLGLKGGFWIFVVPLVALMVFAELCKNDKEKGKLKDINDFMDAKEIEELPLYTFEFKVNKEEKWKIGQVLKRMNYDNIDDLVKNIIYEHIN